jgi:hypothetical protein
VKRNKNDDTKLVKYRRRIAGTAVNWTVDEGHVEVDISPIGLRRRGSETAEFYRNPELGVSQNFRCFILYG